MSRSTISSCAVSVRSRKKSGRGGFLSSRRGSWVICSRKSATDSVSALTKYEEVASVDGGGGRGRRVVDEGPACGGYDGNAEAAVSAGAIAAIAFGYADTRSPIVKRPLRRRCLQIASVVLPRKRATSHAPIAASLHFETPPPPATTTRRGDRSGPREQEVLKSTQRKVETTTTTLSISSGTGESSLLSLAHVLTGIAHATPIHGPVHLPQCARKAVAACASTCGDSGGVGVGAGVGIGAKVDFHLVHTSCGKESSGCGWSGGVTRCRRCSAVALSSRAPEVAVVLYLGAIHTSR